MKKMLNVVMLLGLLASQFNAPLTSHAQEPAPSATAMPEPTVADISIQVPSATPNPLPDKGETPTDATAATATPQPTEEPSATPTISPDVTETSTASGIELSLTPTPQFITPGGTATLHWTIDGIDPATHALVLQTVLPDGVTPRAGEGPFEDTSRTLSVPVGDATGQFHLSLADSSDGVTFQVNLLEASQILAVSQVAIIPQEEFTVGTGGGTVSAMKGRLKITVPPGALPEDAKITVGRPEESEAPKGSLSGHAFTIKAHGLQSDSELHQFKDGIQIQAYYADFGIEPGTGDDIFLWWYDPDVGEWAALPSAVDPATGTVTGTTNHFTTFDFDVNDWQSSMMPRVDDFQISQFTGAGTYSYPIQVPDGPGGLKPDVTLNYNSQTVDQSVIDTQSDWLGLGWTLDTGSITLVTRADTKFWLFNAGGVSSSIVQTNDGKFHMLNENFWKVTKDVSANTWKVYDKLGNIYYFGTQSGAFVGACGWQVYQWSLTWVQNVYDQKLTYTYDKEHKNVCGGSGVTATYPATITYPDGRQRIRFEREIRKDYPLYWPSDDAFHFFERSRLKRIYVEVDPTGSGTFTTVRMYEMTYALNGNPNITFPGYTFPGEGQDQASTLISIKMYGDGYSTDELPAATFEYDGLHLIKASNGYGGSVTFSYDNFDTPTSPTTLPFTATDSKPKYKKIDDLEHSFHCLYWKKHGETGSANCVNNTLQISGTVHRNFDDDVHIVRPGAAYKLELVVSEGGQPEGVDVQVGFDFGTGTDQWVCTSGTCLTATVVAPVDATIAKPLVRVTSGTVAFSSITYQMLPTFYRVRQKTVNDGNGHDYTYTYSYSGPDPEAVPNTGAVNDLTNSLPCTGSCKRYFVLYSEFRGHSRVTETAPDGRKTITEFNQGDTTYGAALSGRPATMTVEDPAGNVLKKTLFTYSVTLYTGGLTYPSGFGDVKRTWVTTSAEEDRMYNSDGQNFSATQTSYTYEFTYGNQTLKTESACSAGCVEGQTPTWSLYRSTTTDYSPNATAYIVSLSARTTMRDGGGTTMSQILNLYDGANTYTTAPAAGELTAVRTMVNDPQNIYSQVTYDYDSWGNRTTVTTYTGYGTAGSAPTTGASTTYTCYGEGTTIGRDGQSCSANGNANSVHAYPLWTKDALNHFTSWTYWSYVRKTMAVYRPDLVGSETDSNGNTTAAAYDSFGRITSLTRPGDSATTLSMSYVDSYPFTTTITQHVDDVGGNPVNYSITREYDGIGRQTQSNAGGILSDYTYSYDTSQVSTQSTPHQDGETEYHTNTGYDLLGQPTSVTAPDGTSTTYVYNGLVTTATARNASGGALSKTVTTRDVWGNVVSVVPQDGSGNPIGPSASYEYDVLGHLLTASRGGVSSTMTYDKAWRKIGMGDPDMGNWTYAYDAVGNLTSQTDARNCVLTLGYDILNRLHTKASSGTGCNTQVSTTYNYDEGGAPANAIGRRTSMSSGTVSNSWTYDVRGRVTSATLEAGTPYTTQWTYNYADMPKTMTYPGGEVVNYGYNARMLLNSMIGTATYLTVPDTGGYDSAGRLLNRTLGSGLIQNFVYYPWDQEGGRLQFIKAGTASDNTSLQKLEYNYDPAGNVDWIDDWKAGTPPDAQLQDYSYDALNRLTSASVTGGSDGLYNESYTYNSTTGNLQTKGGLTLSYSAQVSSGCQGEAQSPRSIPHAASTFNGNSYTYDCNGNMTQRVISGQTYTVSYDAENRLVSVSGPSLTASFVYDADGNRVQSAINGVTTTFVGNYYEVSGSTATTYYLAGSSRIAMRTGTSVSYLLSDQLGSTSITADGNGNKISELRYKAWGEVRYTSGTTATKYTYTGQYSNVADFGLMFYNARWYDPTIGRFVQADSIVPTETQGVQAWDRYAYANNSPVINTDPSGHCIWDGCLVEIIALAGLTIAASQIPSDVPQSNPADWGNPDVMVTGLAITAAAPDIAALAGEGLMGLGKLISNPKLFAAGKASYDAATGAAATTLSQTPNEIGTWGEQQVGENLPVNVQQLRVRDPVTGELRIYDGNFETDPFAFVEVKTSTRGTVYATQSIRGQLSIDANIGAESGTAPTWIFVNAQPSRPLMNLMQQFRIPWQQLHVAAAQ